MENKEQTVCFVGHRKLPPEQLGRIERQLEAVIINLIERGYVYFYAGGALGFDTIAARTVLSLKSEYPHIRLYLALPCLSQADKWNPSDREIYEYIKGKADKVVYTSHEYTRGCMFARDRYLVDNSSICVCYLTETTGGTRYTVNYAKKFYMPIINIAN